MKQYRIVRHKCQFKDYFTVQAKTWFRWTTLTDYGGGAFSDSIYTTQEAAEERIEHDQRPDSVVVKEVNV
jgi:hypothetical protein